MAIVTDGLVLYLHGACGKNNPATRVWKDLSGNGNDGELVNFAYTEDSGWGDGGLRFDGVDDYVDTGFRIEGFNNYTIELTLQFKEIDGNINYYLVKSAGDIGRLWITLNRGILCINTYFGAGMDYWDYTMRKPLTNNIYNIVAKFNRLGEQQVFINGEFVIGRDISSASEVAWNNNLPIVIGKGQGLYNYPDIKVYNFKIYNRALTDEEILQNYQAGHEWTPQIGKREVTTTMKPITSSLSRKGTGRREVITTVKPITTSLERKGVGKREVISTMKPITSELNRKGVGRREVISIVKPITTKVTKKLPPIHADMDIRECIPNITTRERIPKLEVD